MIINLAERLVQLREEKNVSQRELARAIHCPQNAIHRMENKLMDPSGTYLWKIADYFGVSIDYLVGRSDIRKFATIDDETKAQIKDAVFQYLNKNPKTYEDIKREIEEHINKEDK